MIRFGLRVLAALGLLAIALVGGVAAAEAFPQPFFAYHAELGRPGDLIGAGGGEVLDPVSRAGARMLPRVRKSWSSATKCSAKWWEWDRRSLA